ncbi:MAG TPA: hypothetical protein VNT23_07555, partial [Gaiellaceae bacterium]|nr:hypothetical protein [Gaiellaceae bacterium]
MDPEQRDELRRWAERLRAAGSTRDARAAAKAIDLLVGEVERLEREVETARAELEARDGAERAGRDRARSQAERARRQEEREQRRRPARELVAVPAAPPPLHDLADEPDVPAPATNGRHADEAP